MSCKCCCTNTLNLCDQNVCTGLDLGITAQIPGAHKLKIPVLGLMVTLEQEFIVGEQIVFQLDNVIEDLDYTCELYDPIGNRILIRKNGIEYDCFRFRTVIGVIHSSVVLGSS